VHLDLELLTQHISTTAENAELARAAVLVGIRRSSAGDEVLLTERAPALRFQGAHLSFPGGRAEPSDRDVVETALREAHEEVGLSPDAFSFVALLDEITIGGRYRTTPVVGVIADTDALFAQESEVTRLIWVPIRGLAEPEALTVSESMHQGRSRPDYCFDVVGLVIWGATARILVQVLERGLPRRSKVAPG
jgi:8-oxo-dGTP pyrophosphatase MutT (NUDIX family)